jgi:hypothetical protein
MVLNGLTQYMTEVMGKLGMQRNLRLGKPEGDIYPLQMRNATFPLQLTQWSECMLHSDVRNVSAEEI